MASLNHYKFTDGIFKYPNGMQATEDSYCEIGGKIGSNESMDTVSFVFFGTHLQIFARESEGWHSGNILLLIDNKEYRFNSNGSETIRIVADITGLENEKHECLCRIDAKTTYASSNPGYKFMGFEGINIDGVILPELSKDYEFPVKTIEKADVEAYAASCINTEEQILIAIEDGSMYLTKGDGTYIECSSGGGTITPPIETHVHDNKPVIDSLNDSAGMLSYKGKVVVNNSEYSFKTLPRRKAPTNTKEINSTKGGRLPWQQ